MSPERRLNEACQNYFSSMSLAQLKELAIESFKDEDSAAVEVLDRVLAWLESVMPEAEFIEFCESIG
jgi:K+-sensing histidine kinase KdpD